MTTTPDWEEKYARFVKEYSQSGLFDRLQSMDDGEEILRSFISSLLAEKRDEMEMVFQQGVNDEHRRVVEMVKRMQSGEEKRIKHLPWAELGDPDQVFGYNVALSDVLTALQANTTS